MCFHWFEWFYRGMQGMLALNGKSVVTSIGSHSVPDLSKSTLGIYLGLAPLSSPGYHNTWMFLLDKFTYAFVFGIQT